MINHMGLVVNFILSKNSEGSIFIPNFNWAHLTSMQTDLSEIISPNLSTILYCFEDKILGETTYLHVAKMEILAASRATIVTRFL